MVGYNALFVAVFIVIGYLCGSILFGVLVGRLFKKDPRDLGSSSAGATNVTRTVHWSAGLLTLCGDGFKGAAAVLTAYGIWRGAADLGFAGWTVLAAGLGAVIGHCWPVFFNFRGGKGIATTWAVLLVFSPPDGALLFGVWLIVVSVCEYVSAGSLAAALLAPAIAYFIPQNYYFIVAPSDTGTVDAAMAAFCGAAALIIVVRHAKNIVRMWQGTENKVRWHARIKRWLRVA